jgi:ketosteroid isomerase-like protein
MSQENVEIVEAALNASDTAGSRRLRSTGRTTSTTGQSRVQSMRGPMKGKAAVAAYVQDWLDTFDELTSEPIELIDVGGDQVIAVLRISGRAKLSGVETDLTYAVVYTIRDGKIARGREYAARDEALEAAGLLG